MLSVPAARIDDFLKSLTVVDEKTGAPAPVDYPRTGGDASGLVDFEIRLGGAGPHRLKLSYVTDAPSWKPTYRAMIGRGGRVRFEGWAIVDNDSGEDWTAVELGVGSSSALSFRYDLRSVRAVERAELGSSDRFAIAPPIGQSPYDGDRGRSVLGELSDDAIAPAAKPPAEEPVSRIERARSVVDRQVAAARIQRDVVKVLCLEDKAKQLEVAVSSARARRQAIDAGGDPASIEHERTVLSVLRQRGDQLLAEAQSCIGEESAFVGQTAVTTLVDPALPPEETGENLAQSARHERGEPDHAATPVVPAAPVTPQPPPARRVPSDLRAVADELRAHPGQAVVEGYARPEDLDPYAASLERATHARQLLIATGVAAERLSAVARGRVDGRSGVRVVRASEAPPAKTTNDPPAEPVGASHFESATRLTIQRGSSAMISILKAETEGEVVYLYDPESARGSAEFPFRALRLENPSDSTLESGPITVFGDGRFVGEGLCEPIPGRSVGFVPFALDRQIVAESRTTESDSAARVLRAEAGELETERVHTRRTVITLHNRLREEATVFVRHTVSPGYELRRGPASRERVGGAHLFRLVVPASGALDVEVEESRSITGKTDVRSPEGQGIAKAWLASAAPGASRDTLAMLAKLGEEAEALGQKLAAVESKTAEEQKRADRLRRELATLRAAHTRSALLAPLDRKLAELDGKLSRGALERLSLEEQLAVVRVRASEAARNLELAPTPAPEKTEPARTSRASTGSAGGS